MHFSFKLILLIGLLSLAACQPQDQSAAKLGASNNAPVLELPSMELPAALSSSYQSAFVDAPQITARRFLDAYDDFAESGPVTRDRVQDHARMRAAVERGKFLSHILAMDMNGDVEITQSEVDASLALPGWSNRPALIESIFDSDHDQDGIIIFPEALHYSRVLYSRFAASDLRPIESYLMLSDLNGDDIVTREEIEIHLYRRLTGPERGGGDGALR